MNDLNAVFPKKGFVVYDMMETKHNGITVIRTYEINRIFTINSNEDLELLISDVSKEIGVKKGNIYFDSID